MTGDGVMKDSSLLDGALVIDWLQIHRVCGGIFAARLDAASSSGQAYYHHHPSNHQTDANQPHTAL